MEVIKGRMYDYNNGRFLSVDPFIQNPTSTQSMNPYTYIFNNPLSGVDPTGYLTVFDRKKDCADVSESVCNQALEKALGPIKAKKNGKKGSGSKYSIVVLDISEIDVDEDCESDNCDFFRRAKKIGGHLTLVIDQRGSIQYIDFNRKENFFSGVVAPALENTYKAVGPGGGAIDCNERGDCSNLEKGLAAADFIPGLGKVIGFVGGVIVVQVAKNIDKADEAVKVIYNSTPVGRRSSPGAIGADAPNASGAGRHNPQHQNGSTQPIQNVRGTVNGVDYSGHAFDQMRNRGLTPSVIENAIKTGEKISGNTPGTSVYVDSVNSVRVVVNKSGRVITVE